MNTVMSDWDCMYQHELTALNARARAHTHTVKTWVAQHLKAIITPNTYILNFKYHFLLKGMRASWRNG